MKLKRILALLFALTIVIVFQARQIQRGALASPESTMAPGNSSFNARGTEQANAGGFRRSLRNTGIPARIPASLSETAATLVSQIRSTIQSPDDGEMENVFTNLWPTLVACDPATAAQFVQGIEDSALREELRRRLSHLWAASDPRGALEWLSQLPDAEERSRALTDVCLAMAEKSPSEALHAAQRLGLDREQSGLMEALVQQWAQADPSAALTWARSCPEGEQRTKAIAGVAFAQSQRDPLNAARLVVAEIPPGPTLTEAAISVLHQWAIREPAAAAEWASQFPEGPLRDRALHELEGLRSSRSDLATEQ